MTSRGVKRKHGQIDEEITTKDVELCNEFLLSTFTTSIGHSLALLSKMTARHLMLKMPREAGRTVLDLVFDRDYAIPGSMSGVFCRVFDMLSVHDMLRCRSTTHATRSRCTGLMSMIDMALHTTTDAGGRDLLMMKIQRFVAANDIDLYEPCETCGTDARCVLESSEQHYRQRCAVSNVCNRSVQAFYRKRAPIIEAALKKALLLPLIGIIAAYLDHPIDFSLPAIQELRGDLFEYADQTAALAHCVSRCMSMSKGIAVEFKKRFGRVDILKAQNVGVGGVAMLQIPHEDSYRSVFYLVTKEKYWEKPTYDSITKAIHALRDACIQQGLDRVCMPRIGCGLDGLDWTIVRDIIDKTFSGHGCLVDICYT